jgi:outer membrane protein assembly factor BamA
MRGYDYLQFLGQKAFFANAELRFPLIEAMLTPVGVLGGLRGTFFVNMGGGGFNGQEFHVWKTGSELYTPFLGYDFFGQPIYGPQLYVDGFRLVDARASYGISLQSAILGFPMHFDWSWRTLFNRDWEDLLFAGAALAADPSGYTRGSDLFRQVKFSFWIGYDF